MEIKSNLLDKTTSRTQQDNSNSSLLDTVKNIWENPIAKVTVGAIGIGAIALVTRGTVKNNARKTLASLREEIAKYQDDFVRVKSGIKDPTNDSYYKGHIVAAENDWEIARKFDNDASALRKKYFEKSNELKNAKLIDKTEPVYTHGDIYWKGYRETYEEFTKRKQDLAKELEELEKQIAKNEEAASGARRLSNSQRAEADSLWNSILKENQRLEDEADQISRMINNLNEQIYKLKNRYRLS